MQHLPMGTVTLLFSDIEGSTQLLEQLGERYTDVLAECRSLLRTAFQACGGHEIDTQGDALIVVFARATDAVCAAVEMQHAMARHAWPAGGAVRIRIGLHTGEPQLSSEGYVGLDVHQAERIMCAGYGGQVLLSRPTRDLVAHSLPEGVGLRDLGEHRLKDLQRSSHLYQLGIAGLQASFPPLKTLDVSRHNLPVQPTQFLGREQEVTAVCDLLSREDVRLLTLTGPGGTGKTRLGLQVAAELSDLFASGVFFVNLAPISDPALVVSAIVETLGIREGVGQSLLESLEENLRQKHLLLLLDNFEQVVSAAEQVAALLVACPQLKVLMTSREVLHVRAEYEFAVPPLAVPDPNRLPDLAALSHYTSVALFLQRAQATRPDFQMTNANARAIAEICTRLDGLPLAIELAAARIKLLPPQALFKRLEQRLAILTGASRDVPARQQTLRNTIAWSYHLLDAAEQRLFRCLSVFVGGCQLSAAEVVCGAGDNVSDGPAFSVLDGIASLIDKSLLQQTEQEVEEPHFDMLETIREYGRECLIASGEVEVTQRAHAAYYLALAEKAEPELGGPQQVMWLERLEREHDNLRAALRWLVEQGEAGHSMERALRLGGALRWLWIVHCHWSEGRTFLERALAGSDGVTASVRAKVLEAAARLALGQGDTDRGEALCKESLTLYRELGDTAGIALSLHLQGSIAWDRSNLAAARSLIEESLALSRDVGDTRAIAASLRRLANVVSDQGEYAKARSLGEESLALFREVDDKMNIAWSLFQLAWMTFAQGDSATVRPLLEEALALFREVDDREGIADFFCLSSQLALNQGDTAMARSLAEESVELYKEMGGRRGFAMSLSRLGRVAAVQGDHAAARALYEESLAIAGEVGYKLDIASCLQGQASIVAAQGEHAWAAQLWGAAESLREVMGAPIPPVYRADYERAVAAARAQLGEKAFAAAWVEGRTMTPEQALAAWGSVAISPSASAVSHLPAPATSSPPALLGLTRRELEVLRLIAMGLPDAQIAERLVLSLYTVHAHLRTIYSKLDVTSRSAATRYAFEHQLVGRESP